MQVGVTGSLRSPIAQGNSKMTVITGPLNKFIDNRVDGFIHSCINDSIRIVTIQLPTLLLTDTALHILTLELPSI